MDKSELLDYCSDYLKDCELKRRLSTKTLKAYKSDLQQYFEFIGAEKTDHKKINEYILFISQMYSKTKTIKRKIASVKAFYAYLEYEGKIECSPFRKIRTQIKESKTLPRIIPKECLMKIFGCLKEDLDNARSDYEKLLAARNIAVIELLFSTGIRIAELCSIKRNDIDIEARTLKIFGKGSKERLLYLGSDPVAEALINYREIRELLERQCDYFFVNRFGHRLSEQAVRLLLNRLEKRLKLSVHITPHMFRHTFATGLLEKDVDIRYIQNILGHSSITITQIYTHVSQPKQKEILTDKNPMNDYLAYEKTQ